MFQTLPLGGRPIYGNCLIYMMTSTLLPFQGHKESLQATEVYKQWHFFPKAFWNLYDQSLIGFLKTLRGKVCQDGIIYEQPLKHQSQGRVGVEMGSFTYRPCPPPGDLQGTNMNCSNKFQCSDVRITPYIGQIHF